MTRSGGPPRRRWRVLRLAALSLLLGFLTTWAVAWGCRLWSPMDSRGYEHSVVANSSTGIQRRTGWCADYLIVGFGPDESQSVESRFSNLATVHNVPRWSRTFKCWSRGQPSPVATAPVPPQNQVSELGWVEGAFGWPLLSHHCIFDAYILRLGTTPPQGISVTTNDCLPGRLPFRPLWSGLALNTVFYTATWFLLLLGMGAAHRRWRMRRGRCPRCNYDLRGDFDPGCPECGWGREPEPRTPDASEEAT